MEAQVPPPPPPPNSLLRTDAQEQGAMIHRRLRGGGGALCSHYTGGLLLLQVCQHAYTMPSEASLQIPMPCATNNHILHAYAAYCSPACSLVAFHDCASCWISWTGGALTNISRQKGNS